MKDTAHARIFRFPLLVMELSVQKDDRYLVAVAERFVNDELHLHIDAYLLDKKMPNAEAKNLTRGRYGEILDAAYLTKRGCRIHKPSVCSG